MLAASCFASPLRLMAMGDMLGVIDDDSDYLWDVSYLPLVHKSSVSLTYLDNSFRSLLPDNEKTPYFSDVLDVQRKGQRNEYGADIITKLGDGIALELRGESKMHDFTSSYIDQSGTEEILNRKGVTGTSVAAIGMDFADFFAVGVGYENMNINDTYTGTEPLRDGISCEETGNSEGMYYAIRFHGPDYFFTIGSGSSKTSVLETADKKDGLVQRYTITGPVRAHMMFGGKVFDGALGLRYGGFVHKTPYGLDGRSLLGMQIVPTDRMIIGLGYMMDYDRYWVNILRMSLGIEYAFTNWFKLRLGIEKKELRSWGYTPESFLGGYDINADPVTGTDYSAGFEYGLFDGLSIEFAYKDYLDVEGGYESFGAASDYVAYKDYWYSASQNRNHLAMGEIKYEF